MDLERIPLTPLLRQQFDNAFKTQFLDGGEQVIVTKRGGNLLPEDYKTQFGSFQKLAVDFEEWASAEQWALVQESFSSQDRGASISRQPVTSEFLQENPLYATACCWNVQSLLNRPDLSDPTSKPVFDFLCEGNQDFFIEKQTPSSKCDLLANDLCAKVDFRSQPFCGCYNDTIDSFKSDEVFYEQMQVKDPSFDAKKCIMNRCRTPIAYKNKEMRMKRCPRLCAAVSRIPENVTSSRTSCRIECDARDIVVNNITPEESLEPSLDDTQEPVQSFPLQLISGILGFLIVMLFLGISVLQFLKYKSQ